MFTFQFREFVLDVGMVEEFVDIANNHIVSMASRFFPARVFDVVVNGVAESVGVEFDDCGVFSGAYDVDGTISGVVVVESEVVDKRLVVLEHEWEHVLFVPADCIVVNDGVVDAMEQFVQS